MTNVGKVIRQNNQLLTRNYFPTAAVNEICLCCRRSTIWIVVYMINFHPAIARQSNSDMTLQSTVDKLCTKTAAYCTLPLATTTGSAVNVMVYAFVH